MFKNTLTANRSLKPYTGIPNNKFRFCFLWGVREKDGVRKEYTVPSTISTIFSINNIVGIITRSKNLEEK